MKFIIRLLALAAVAAALTAGGCMQEISREERTYAMTFHGHEPAHTGMPRNPTNLPTRKARNENPWWKPAWLWGTDESTPAGE